MRIRTWLSRASFAAAAVLLVLALVAPALVEAQEDPDAGRPASFQASAFTTAFEAIINTEPASTVPEIVRFDVPLGQSEFESGNRSFARAASIWPGLTVAKGGSLLCTAGFPCDGFKDDDGETVFNPFEPLPTGFPPRWPFAAEASYPTAVDAEARLTKDQAAGHQGAAGPLTFTIDVVEAHAGRDFVSSRAVVTDLDLPVPGAEEASPETSLVHIGALQSTTRHEFEGDVLVAFAESRLTDIDLFAGQVHIDKVVARSTSRSDGDTNVESDPRITVEGVTVAGQEAKITDGGLELLGPVCAESPITGIPVPEIPLPEELSENLPVTPPNQVPVPAETCTTDQGLLEALNSGLKTLSEGDVRLIDTSTVRDDGRTDGDATALMVSFKADASGFPSGAGVIGNLILGLSSTSSGVGSLSGGDIDLDIGDFGTVTAPFDAGGFVSDGTQVAGQQVINTPGTEGTPGQVIPGNGGGQTQAGFAPLELLAGIAADRIQLLYGAWALAVLGLALASRLQPFRLVTRR